MKIKLPADDLCFGYIDVKDKAYIGDCCYKRVVECGYIRVPHELKKNKVNSVKFEMDFKKQQMQFQVNDNKAKVFAKLNSPPT